MKQIYIIVECGYEGISKILFACIEKQEIIDKINELRMKAKPIKYNQDNIVDELDNMPHEKLMETYRYDYSADDICVMLWDEKAERYSCVCNKLGVLPSKTMIY